MNIFKIKFQGVILNDEGEAVEVSFLSGKFVKMELTISCWKKTQQRLQNPLKGKTLKSTETFKTLKTDQRVKTVLVILDPR